MQIMWLILAFFGFDYLCGHDMRKKGNRNRYDTLLLFILQEDKIKMPDNIAFT